MTTDAELFRQRAQEQYDEAERSPLPNVRARALHAAERWSLMAEQAERASVATMRRDAEKAERDAKRDPRG